MCQPPNAKSPATSARRKPRGSMLAGAAPASAACRPPNSSDQRGRRSRAILVMVSAGLHRAAGPHADVVDRREHDDAGDGDEADAEIAQRHDRRRVAAEHHRDGGDDAGVHAPEHRPAPEEPGGRRKHLAEEDVDAAGARVGGRQLGADARAEPGQRAGDDPDQQHAAEGRHRAADLGRLHEDRRADDGADDHRGGLGQADRARELVGHRRACYHRLTSWRCDRSGTAPGRPGGPIRTGPCYGRVWPVDRLDRREGVGLGRGLVGPIALDAREAQREAAGILRARLDVVERDLDDDLRAARRRCSRRGRSRARGTSSSATRASRRSAP